MPKALRVGRQSRGGGAHFGPKRCCIGPRGTAPPTLRRTKVCRDVVEMTEPYGSGGEVPRELIPEIAGLPNQCLGILDELGMSQAQTNAIEAVRSP